MSDAVAARRSARAEFDEIFGMKRFTRGTRARFSGSGEKQRRFSSMVE
jgi:hypothetical protein